MVLRLVAVCSELLAVGCRVGKGEGEGGGGKTCEAQAALRKKK